MISANLLRSASGRCPPYQYLRRAPLSAKLAKTFHRSSSVLKKSPAPVRAECDEVLVCKSGCALPCAMSAGYTAHPRVQAFRFGSRLRTGAEYPRVAEQDEQASKDGAEGERDVLGVLGGDRRRVEVRQPRDTRRVGTLELDGRSLTQEREVGRRERDVLREIGPLELEGLQVLGVLGEECPDD